MIVGLLQEPGAHPLSVILGDGYRISGLVSGLGTCPRGEPVAMSHSILSTNLKGKEETIMLQRKE